MAEKTLNAEIVKSGTWLYDSLVPHEVWIVRQNFDFYYEEGYEDHPEALTKTERSSTKSSPTTEPYAASYPQH